MQKECGRERERERGHRCIRHDINVPTQPPSVFVVGASTLNIWLLLEMGALKEHCGCRGATRQGGIFHSEDVLIKISSLFISSLRLSKSPPLNVPYFISPTPHTHYALSPPFSFRGTVATLLS